tara:strand:+ start:1199 stop:2860 length:1662 start_codon:yes stop_codon:yes gene_type:complete
MAQLKDKLKLDTSLIDLYLGGKDSSIFYPSIPQTIYSESTINQLSPSEIEDYATNSNTRSIPITPLRCAWEMGNKWSKYLYDIKLVPGDGGVGSCPYENAWGSEKNPRQVVVGMDGEHYDVVCDDFLNGYQRGENLFRRAGYNPDDNYQWDSKYLPFGFLTYRGWAGCTGWEGFRQDRWSTAFGSGLYSCAPEGSDARNEYGCMNNGHFWIGFSQVCDTGDPLAQSNSGQETTGCNTTCNNMVTAMANPTPCFSTGYQRHGGAVGFIGPSDLDTDTRFNNMIQGLFVDSIVLDGYRELGEIYDNAKAKFVWGMENVNCYCEDPDCDNDSLADFFYMMVYHLSGDPSLPIYTGKPSKISTDLDQFYTPSPWGRFQQRPKSWPSNLYKWEDMDGNDMSDSYLPESGRLEDEIALSISQGNPITVTPTDENTGEPLIGANVTLIYKEQAPFPFDQVYSHCEDGNQQGCIYVPDGEDSYEAYGPKGMKNYMTYLLKYGEVNESGSVTIENWNLPETYIDDLPGGLTAGSYLQMFINTETIRHGKPYEQKVITFRLTE